MSNIKVGFHLYFQGGGIGRYSLEQLEALTQLPGIDYHLLCSPDFEWQEIDKVSTHADLMSLHHRVPSLRRARFLLAQFMNPGRVQKAVDTLGLDIMHFGSFHHMSYRFWGPKLKASGVKVTIAAHDVLRLKSILNAKWENQQLAESYRDADAIFVHSEFQAEQLCEFAQIDREKAYVVPHGPYEYERPAESKLELRVRYGIAPEACLGLFFGQLRDEKNLEALIRAWPRERDDWHLLVAGQGGGKHKSASYYEALAKSCGISNRVTFIDRFIEDCEVGALFTAADWLALPYDASFVSQSGVLNIAAVYDLPILVCEAPVLKETVDHANIGVSVDSDKLDSGIIEICERVAACEQFEFESYRSANSWDENARITADVFRQIL